jgi:hypothetical protein
VYRPMTLAAAFAGLVLATPLPAALADTTLQPDERGGVEFLSKDGELRCGITEEEVVCSSHHFKNPPLQDGQPTNGVIFHQDGAFRYAIGDSATPSDKLPRLDYGTYHAVGWTIVAADDGSLKFTYDALGRTMYVSLDKVTTSDYPG